MDEHLGPYAKWNVRQRKANIIRSIFIWNIKTNEVHRKKDQIIFVVPEAEVWWMGEQMKVVKMYKPPARRLKSTRGVMYCMITIGNSAVWCFWTLNS